MTHSCARITSPDAELEQAQESKSDLVWVWRLYMAAWAVGFDDGGVSIHQTLGVRPAPTGASAMPMTRSEMV